MVRWGTTIRAPQHCTWTWLKCSVNDKQFNLSMGKIVAMTLCFIVSVMCHKNDAIIMFNSNLVSSAGKETGVIMHIVQEDFVN